MTDRLERAIERDINAQETLAMLRNGAVPVGFGIKEAREEARLATLELVEAIEAEGI